MMYVNYAIRIQPISLAEAMEKTGSPADWPVHERTLEWHRGDKLPSEQLDGDEIEIISIFADGPEKATIEYQFDGIPKSCMAKTCVWRGDFAQFIFDNLAVYGR